MHSSAIDFIQNCLKSWREARKEFWSGIWHVLETELLKYDEIACLSLWWSLLLVSRSARAPPAPPLIGLQLAESSTAKPSLLRWKEMPARAVICFFSEEKNQSAFNTVKASVAIEQQVVTEDWWLLSVSHSLKVTWKYLEKDWTPLFCLERCEERQGGLSLVRGDTVYHHGSPCNPVFQSNLVLYAFSVIYLQKCTWISLLLFQLIWSLKSAWYTELTLLVLYMWKQCCKSNKS